MFPFQMRHAGGDAAPAPESTIYVDMSGVQWAGAMNADGTFHQMEKVFHQASTPVVAGHAYAIGPIKADGSYDVTKDLGVVVLPVAVPRVPTPAEAAPASFAAPSPAPAAPVPGASSPVQVGMPTGVHVTMPDLLSKEYWTPWNIAGAAVAVASAGLSAYHGFKRNGDSPGWMLVWGALGFGLPVVTPLVAVAQGFGKPSDDVRLHRLENALGHRPDIARALGVEMSSAKRLNASDAERSSYGT